jgi:hypothetical protein
MLFTDKVNEIVQGIKDFQSKAEGKKCFPTSV